MPSSKKTTPTKKAPAKVAKKNTPVKKAEPKKVIKKTTKEVVEKDVPMKVFTCQGCNNKFPDMGLYFYNKSSKKCLWCTKFPSRNKTKVDNKSGR